MLRNKTKIFYDREIQRLVPRIDCLINNAGVFMTEYQASRDGHEMTFAVNVLAHYLLTLRLKVFFLSLYDNR
jgi:NAD(P)-dependent dehydrogenase (short-subunit alcohol dehydrogenase family)